MLAYSTIAHAGYLMMGAAAAVALMGVSSAGASRAVAALVFYLATYLFMNLAAFAIVALLRNRLRSEEIAAYAGLVRTSPGIVVATTVVLVSVISLFYYLRVLKVMTFDPPPSDRVGEALPLVSLSGGVVTALAVPVVILGLFWSGLYAAAQLAGTFAS
jgi:NADH-quinone oxidoreductase subunit N